MPQKHLSNFVKCVYVLFDVDFLGHSCNTLLGSPGTDALVFNWCVDNPYLRQKTCLFLFCFRLLFYI